MKEKKINVAFVGCGRIADLHARPYAKSKGARIYAVCDMDPSIAQARKKQWKAEKIVTFDEALRDPNIDALEILTPQVLHESMVIRALQAGKHVAVQKPMTIDLASADRMIEAAHHSGKVFKVTENYVFYPPVVRAKKMIEEGRIGDVTGIRIKYIGGSSGGWNVPASSWEWRMKETAAGRGLVMFDHGHHLWSTAWFLLGKSERLTAWVDSQDGVVDCPSVVMWKYADGKKYGICDLMQSADLAVHSKYYANDEWIEITGSRGILFIHRCTGEIHSGPILSVYDGEMRHYSGIDSDWGSGFVGASRNFIDSICGNEKPMLRGEDAREILRFALAIQKSSRTRREVYLEELDSAWPWLYRWSQIRKEKKSKGEGGFFRGRSLARYAPQAASLTEKLIERFDAKAAGNWETVIGLFLSAEGGNSDLSFSLVVKNGQARLENVLRSDAKLTVRIPAGTWAAILLGKKRIEMALLQGQIKVEGQAEEGLKLRSVFKI